MGQRQLTVLDELECRRLLGQAQIGRLVYLDDDGPAAVPVNYAMAGGDVVIRVEGGVKQQAMCQPALAFEVDDIDVDERSGWSVLVRGTGREVAVEEVPDLLRRIEGRLPTPWADGVHNVWLVLTPERLTGRRLAGVVLHAI
jgi:nitroimidazol reductase NimA-like FMN-containing flavoprotein (pyridoxamine 5'-phosphate oxidase superfamily)